MNTDPKEHTDPDCHWFIPAIAVKLADGATMIRPGKAVLRASVNYTEKLVGMEGKTLKKLADEGLITRGNPSPGKVYYYPGQIQKLMLHIERNPDFWENPKTRQAYLAANRSQDQAQ